MLRNCHGGNEDVVGRCTQYSDIFGNVRFSTHRWDHRRGVRRKKTKAAQTKKSKRKKKQKTRAPPGEKARMDGSNQLGASLPFIRRLFLSNAGRFFPIDAAIVDSHLQVPMPPPPLPSTSTTPTAPSPTDSSPILVWNPSLSLH